MFDKFSQSIFLGPEPSFYLVDEAIEASLFNEICTKLQAEKK